MAGAPGPAGTASVTFVLEAWTLSAKLVSVCTTTPLQQKDMVGSLFPDAAPARALHFTAHSPEGPLVLAWGQPAVPHPQGGKPRVAEHVTA